MSLFRDLLVLQGYIADPRLLAELEARRAPAPAQGATPQPAAAAPLPPPVRREEAPA